MLSSLAQSSSAAHAFILRAPRCASGSSAWPPGATDAARRDVDDPLQRQPVVGVGDGAQVADQVLDLRAVEEAGAAHDDVGQVVRAERILQHARLRVGPVEDREVARAQPILQTGLDARRDELRLVALGLTLEQHDSLALARLGEQALGAALGVARDDRVGGAQDVAGRSVVLLELDHARAGVVALEVEDVADVGAAPLVDRLVLVADHGDAAGAPRQAAHQTILHAVGVLELVDQHVVEALGDLVRGRRVAQAQLQRRDQQAAEVGGVGGRQALLVQLVGARDHVFEVVAGLKRRGGDALVLGAIDRRQHLAHGEHALGHLQVRQHAAEQALLVVVVVDDEVLAQTHRLAPVAQQARRHRVERAHPQPVGGAADQLLEPRPHLAGGLVGEGQGQDALGVDAVRDQVRDAHRQHPGLAAAGSGEDQQGTAAVGDGLALGIVEGG